MKMHLVFVSSVLLLGLPQSVLLKRVWTTTVALGNMQQSLFLILYSSHDVSWFIKLPLYQVSECKTTDIQCWLQTGEREGRLIWFLCGETDNWIGLRQNILCHICFWLVGKARDAACSHKYNTWSKCTSPPPFKLITLERPCEGKALMQKQKI